MDAYGSSLLANFLVHFEALEKAVEAGDNEAVFRCQGDALGWLYRLEEHQKRQEDHYYARRNADEDGKAVAGLVWLRGLLDHRKAHLREIALQSMGVYAIAEDGQLQRLGVYVASEGEMQELKMHMPISSWPARASLPTPDKGYPAHGRDLLYDSHVAGKPLTTPLRAVQRFFEAS